MGDSLFNIVRPQRFSEVIGQDNTIKSIQMALSKGMLEHALIFYGHTGDGKTTVARIVAKYLECENVADIEPCCTCASCQGIRKTEYSDYVELNAATDGGKDDIDKLIQEVYYAPFFGGVKVYLIDEAHMLTSSAWKSLLKIIEEPPSHVYFIFCTTEFDSIPKEIKNRCGKYVFKRIVKGDIVKSLQGLRLKQKVNYTDDALEVLAEHADGSMRNAINYFSHISMPFSDGEEIGVAEVEKYLSIVGPETMASFVDALCNRNLLNAMNILAQEEAATVGADVFLKSVLCAISDSITVLSGAALNREVNESYKAILEKIATCGTTRLSSVAGELNSTYSRVHERTYSSIKISVMKLCMLADQAGNEMLLNSLLERMEQLEKNVAAHRFETNQSASVENVGCQEESMSENEVLQNVEQSYVEDGYEQQLESESVSDCEVSEPESKDVGTLSELAMLFQDDEENLSDQTSQKDGDNIPTAWQNEAVEQTRQTQEMDPGREELQQSEWNMQESVSFGDCQSGFVFSSPELAAQFKKSQSSPAYQIKKKLQVSCEDNEMLAALIDGCDMQETANGVVLATPFEPTAQVLKLMLGYENLTGIEVYALDNVEIRK